MSYVPNYFNTKFTDNKPSLSAQSLQSAVQTLILKYKQAAKVQQKPEENLYCDRDKT